MSESLKTKCAWLELDPSRTVDNVETAILLSIRMTSRRMTLVTDFEPFRAIYSSWGWRTVTGRFNHCNPICTIVSSRKVAEYRKQQKTIGTSTSSQVVSRYPFSEFSTDVKRSVVRSRLAYVCCEEPAGNRLGTRVKTIANERISMFSEPSIKGARINWPKNSSAWWHFNPPSLHPWTTRTI